MKRGLAQSLLALLVSCASDTPVNEPTRPPERASDPRFEWSGPPLAVTQHPDGSVDVCLTAPTGGHSFELVAVATKRADATVRMLWRKPGDAIVTQVLTKLPVHLDAAKLQGANRIAILVATANGPSEKPGPEELAAYWTRSR